ncbi:Ger(x)C family spore germination protein [Paenibacillus humicola]|uniref:Ger(x)C family spore germination protein n=1 Tax=Paenibacillus humicola TaxID=3110540 RepID=UPI00237A6F27|nr:Ger(x)C family spore germination protein [Paenibacillus humicola]
MKLLQAAAIAVIFALLAGCWDRVEIDQRGFVVGVAIDRSPQNADPEKHYSVGERMLGTFQFIVPAGLKGSGSGEEGTSATRSYFNLAVKESSINALSARLATATSRAPYYEHLKLIVISAEVAREDADFADILDFFLRDNEMRRDMHVLIADRGAGEIMKEKPPIETYPVAFVESAIGNTRKSNYMVPVSRIGDIHGLMLGSSSFTIQRVRVKDGRISLIGAALFEGERHRLVGMLNGAETQGLNFLRNQVKGGIVQTEYNGKSIAFDLERASRSIRAKRDKLGRYTFDIRIRTEGTLTKSVRDNDLNNPENFEKLQTKFEEQIEKVAKLTIRTLQKEYKLDALGLGEYLRQNKYREWKPIASDWDRGENLFADAKIEVKAKVSLRRIGDINESERR